MKHHSPIIHADYFYQAGAFAKAALSQESSADRSAAERRAKIRKALAAMQEKINKDLARNK